MKPSVNVMEITWCSCDHPIRARSAEGVAFCSECGDQLVDPLLATLLAELRALRRQVDELEQGGSRNGRPELVTVDALADALGVKPGYVYDHAEELGVVRLPGGHGGRGRLRFNLERALQVHRSAEPEPTPAKRQRPARARDNGDLLPIKGASA